MIIESILMLSNSEVLLKDATHIQNAYIVNHTYYEDEGGNIEVMINSAGKILRYITIEDTDIIDYWYKDNKLTIELEEDIL